MENTHKLHRHFASYFNDQLVEPFVYVLSKRMENGHICIPVNSSIDEELKEGGYLKQQSFKDSSLVTSNETDLKPFVLFNDKFYLQRYFQYETTILNRLESLAKSKGKFTERSEALRSQIDFIREEISPVEDLSSYSAEEKPDWQAVAAIQGVLNNLTIITGGPGTGKTTSVAKILALLKKTEGDQLKIALAAPTGKAAVRMKESLLASVIQYKGLNIEDVVNKTEPKTLHRLLGTNLNSPFFKHNSTNPLPYDVVIVDESSMISVAMFSKLLAAIGENTRIIILGDSEQLASVDAGSLFGDVCLSQKETENQFANENLKLINSLIQPDRVVSYVLEKPDNFLNQHLVRLKKTYRFDQNSKMGRFTQAIIKGESGQLESIINSPDDDCLFVDYDYKTTFFENFLKKYKAYIEEVNIEQALIKLNNCRVLCANRESEQGIYKVNERIQSFLKREFANQIGLFNPSGELYHNQLIMVTKNQPDLNLFNGDVGIVRRDDKNKLKVYFPQLQSNSVQDENKKYHVVTPGFIEQWETVFAMTIHKSQGSEFKDVFVMLPKNQDNRILTRELLYTGITRAKERAYIQGTLEVIVATADRFVNRVSGIKERIQNN
ncbi:exodeoxyribonuclease V subunit alpha [Kaistella flava (ex Peng et al. 2021)]|uniref:RecBCD enzyme subunit RecD n=1 Tax=Kaistella flava (ex Peng et al. 2021) TaxID=2038776 RepID=A0A7M2Y7Y3_9FLAO|nr:exodeoxyribonuclease V subunit alpha [Kaistella flava (ex Peng et al. 2021)]QOW09774.1 exodeoxyribonuclease V subunit alpha [Kaistella flava (ex Peng et al. 2021)]